MAKKDKSAHIEDQAQIDALEEFAPKVREILRDYRAKRQLSSIAKRLGFHQFRLTDMITKNKNGEYKKRITSYYLGGSLIVAFYVLLSRLSKKPWPWYHTHIFYTYPLNSGHSAN